MTRRIAIVAVMIEETEDDAADLDETESSRIVQARPMPSLAACGELVREELKRLAGARR
jgi:hypothetical protein